MATAELERVAVEHVLGIGNAHLTEQVYGEGAGAPATEVRVLKDYFLDLLADGNDGVQRRTCILEYQGDLLTADVADLLGGHAQQLAAVVGDAALDDLAGEWHELKHGEGGYSLAEPLSPTTPSMESSSRARETPLTALLTPSLLKK